MGSVERVTDSARMAGSRLPRFYGAGAEFYPGKTILFVHEGINNERTISWGQPLTTPLTVEQLADAIIAKQDKDRKSKEDWTEDQHQLYDKLVMVLGVLQDVRLAGFEMPGENTEALIG